MQTKTESLERRALRSSLRATLGQALALFLAAGTLDYWQAWLYLGLQALSTAGTNAYLLHTDRALMERRLAFEERGESEPVQKLFFAALFPLLFALLVCAGLDRRFGWSQVPFAWQITGHAAVALGTWLVFIVLRANSYASSVIEVESQQGVVSTGPYRWVRHPMYSGMLLATLGAGVALGSYLAQLFFLPLCALFVVRLRAEELLLAGELPGYESYMRDTRHRLVPGLW